MRGTIKHIPIPAGKTTSYKNTNVHQDFALDAIKMLQIIISEPTKMIILGLNLFYRIAPTIFMIA